MKLLFYACKPLSWPFFIVGGVLSVIGMGIAAVGGWVHDQTEYRVWLVLHKRWCAARFSKQNNKAE